MTQRIARAAVIGCFALLVAPDASAQATRPLAHGAEEGAQRPERSRSLKEAAGTLFKIGVGVSNTVVQNPEDVALIRQHFQMLTPENCMKPQSIHPGEDRWNFEAADRFVAFARAQQLEVVGHCLVWAKDDRTAPWMMQENGKPVSRKTLLRRLETHIHTVVERYAAAVSMWDVVNEAVTDGTEGLLRDSVYARTAGIDFIVTAFKAARARDPDALLIYNDYNCHKPGKRAKILELLAQLKQLGAPVDAYGIQGHFELGEEAIPELRKTFRGLRELGLKVVVSELDIDVVTRSRWWAEGGKHRAELARYDPYQNGLPEAVAQKQAQQYTELFKLLVENSDIIERVSFWNLHDGQSWLNYFPWRRVNHPLLFDRQRQPKRAFDAVYDVLQQQKPLGRMEPQRGAAAGAPRFHILNWFGNVTAGYDKALPFAEGMAAVNLGAKLRRPGFRRGGKWGYVDQKGELVIPIQYEDVASFSEGLARVREGRETHFIDKTGKKIISLGNVDAGDFREGVAPVRSWLLSPGSRTRFINPRGQTEFTVAGDAGEFHEGMAVICVSTGPGKDAVRYGFIDRTGRLKIAPQFYAAQAFSEGLAAVATEKPRTGTEGGLWGYLDKEGKLVIAPQFNEARSFKGGIASVHIGGKLLELRDAPWHWTDGKWRRIDRKGKFVEP